MSTSTLQDPNSTKAVGALGLCLSTGQDSENDQGDICDNVVIANAASNTVPMSIQALITAVQELDASLRDILNLLARLKRGKPIAIRWLTIDEVCSGNLYAVCQMPIYAPYSASEQVSRLRNSPRAQ
jgi:hypothetical protein